MYRSSSSVPEGVVARRAFERFVSRGFSHGHALEDWLAAEAELRAEVIARTAAPAAVEPPPAATAPITAPAARPARKRASRPRRR